MTAVTEATRLRIRPLGVLGAEVTGGTLDPLSPADEATIKQAIRDHLVLRFRGYALDDKAFTRLGERFGELQPSPDYARSRKVYLADLPMMTIISNVKENGEAIGEHGDGELNWHTDLAFTDYPSEYTMLMAREVPPSGGNTWFANMYAAYEAMPEDLKQRVARLKMKHQASHNAQGGTRPGYKDIETNDVREMPGPIHPIVRTHPVSGRKALFLGRRFGAYIPGLPLAKSEALCDELWTYAAKPENTWAQEWQVGDLIIWDNRCTMHRRDAFVGMGRRRMHRLTTRGTRPE
jgi:taurine dioxygenase